jgi:hypothetical protein
LALSFVPLSLNCRDDYIDLFSKSCQRASDYSFINIWAWADERDFEWAFDEDLCWLRTMSPSPALWAPIGLWKNKDWRKVLESYFPAGAVFYRVPEMLALQWQKELGDSVKIEEERSEWEYIYRVSELISLSGNRFHKKKNLLQQFLRSYAYTYEPITSKNIPYILEMQEKWCKWRNCDDSPGLKAESEAVHRILEQWQVMPNIMGGVLKVDGQMVAYTVAESSGEDTVIIHFEKGLTDYKGVYQAINQMFLERSAHSFTWVNREQDMGIEGIRKAKISYNPVYFLKKFIVTWDR